MINKFKKFYKESKVTFILLVICIGYFLLLSLLGGSENSAVLLRYGAFYPPIIMEFHQYYRFITSIFIHIGITHLFFNGYALYVFGPIIEKIMGGKKYLIFFLLTGMAGNLATLIFNYNSLSAGASGSIFGLLGVFLYLIHRHKGVISQKGKNDILYLILSNLVLTFIVPSISITGHLGGLIGGYLLSYLFIK